MLLKEKRLPINAINIHIVIYALPSGFSEGALVLVILQGLSSTLLLQPFKNCWVRYLECMELPIILLICYLKRADSL